MAEGDKSSYHLIGGVTLVISDGNGIDVSGDDIIVCRTVKSSYGRGK